MARLKKLPRRGTWEVDLLPFPEIRITDVPLEGMLFVAEVSTGLARVAAPVPMGADLAELLIEATAASSGAPAGRPKTLRCPAHLMGRLREAARSLGARIVPADHLPTVQALADGLSQHVGAPLFMVDEPASWRPLVRELVREAPWETLHDRVVFHLEHPELEGWFGTVLGQAGEQHGITFYPGPEAFAALMAHRPGADLPPAFSCVCVHLDPLSDLSHRQHRWTATHGLLHDGLALVAFQMDASGPHPLPDSSRWLAASQAVLASWRTHGDALLDGPTHTDVVTPIGPVTVTTTIPEQATPDEPPEPFAPEEHQLFLEADATGTRLCLKAAKRDAERIARRLADVRAVQILRGDQGIAVLFRMADHDVRWIGGLPLDAAVAFDEEVTIIAMKGGARRQSYRVTDVLHHVMVPVETIGW